MKQNSLLFIGPISPPVTGPGVKNKYIVESLKELSNVNLILQNTLGWSSHPVSFLISFIKNVVQSKQVFVSVSKKGRFVFSTLLYFISIFINIKYIIFPAGGSLDEEIEELPFFLRKLFCKALQKADMILVESKALQARLETMGFTNLAFFPNPRKDEHYRWKEKNRDKKRVVFLSKIREGKGVLLLLNALKEIDRQDISLEYFGPIEKAFEDNFYKEINKYSFASYGGIVEPQNVQKTLSDADIFVFPTLFDEGLPGVIVEASFTGVPLITSSFKACDEYIEHQKNGLVVEQNNVQILTTAIAELLENTNLRATLSTNLLNLSTQFNIDILTKELLQTLQNKQWRI